MEFALMQQPSHIFYFKVENSNVVFSVTKQVAAARVRSAFS